MTFHQKTLKKLEIPSPLQYARQLHLLYLEDVGTKYKPFWNDKLDVAVKTFEKARKSVEKRPSTQNMIAYNKASAEAKLLTNTSTREKFKDTCGNFDLTREGNKAWSLIRNLSGESRKTNPKPLELPHETIADEQKRANIQNKFFANVTKANKLKKTDIQLLKELKLKEKSPKPNIRLFEEDFPLAEMTKSLYNLK